MIERMKVLTVEDKVSSRGTVFRQANLVGKDELKGLRLIVNDFQHRLNVGDILELEQVRFYDGDLVRPKAYYRFILGGPNFDRDYIVDVSKYIFNYHKNLIKIEQRLKELAQPRCTCCGQQLEPGISYPIRSN